MAMVTITAHATVLLLLDLVGLVVGSLDGGHANVIGPKD